MKILLTGSHGFIGSHLKTALEQAGHTVIPTQGDLSLPSSYESLPRDIDAAYFLIHTMGKAGAFEARDAHIAELFATYLNQTTAQQVIYLSGISSAEHLSRHLQSRRNVETVLAKSKVPLTVLRAAIVLGPGSASFHIVRDLVERLPVMIAPKWVSRRVQPIALQDALECLTLVLGNPQTYRKTFEIGGPDVLSYRELLLAYAQVRGLTRWIWVVPVLTPHLSSWWLYLITRVPFPLAQALVDSLSCDCVVTDQAFQRLFPKHYLTASEALRKSLTESEFCAKVDNS